MSPDTARTLFCHSVSAASDEINDAAKTTARIMDFMAGIYAINRRLNSATGGLEISGNDNGIDRIEKPRGNKAPPDCG